MIKRRNIFEMFGAQTYGTLVNTIDKLLTIPLFLTFWGVDLFGEWLVLRAIPSYLAVAELGFATAAANRMSVEIVRGDRDQALSYFQAAFIVLLTGSLALVVLMMASFAVIDFRHAFNFSSAFDYNLPLVIALFLGYVIIVFQTQLLSAAYRSVGRYVYASYLTYHIRIVELLALILVLICGGGLVSAALAYFFVRLTGALWMAKMLVSQESWLKIGISSKSFTAVREMLPDASGFLAFPLGQAMSLQGTVFVISNIFSPAAVALFTACRMLSRTLVQLGMQVNRSVWPEMTRLCAAGNREGAQRVFVVAASSFLWVGGIASVILLLLSPWIFKVWTMGKMSVDPTIFGILLTVALLNGIWFSALSILAATDTHKKAAIVYLCAVTLSLPTSYYFANFMGLEGVAWAVLLAEVVVLFQVLSLALKQVDLSPLEFLRVAVAFPMEMLNMLKLKIKHGK